MGRTDRLPVIVLIFRRFPSFQFLGIGQVGLKYRTAVHVACVLPVNEGKSNFKRSL